MRINRGFRYRLEPTPEQEQLFDQFAGVCRLVYNLALEQRRDYWRQYKSNVGRSISWASQSREVSDLRREYDWIAAVPRVCLEQALRDLDKAFGAFFAGRARYPKFRRSGLNDSLYFLARDIEVRRLNRKWATVRLPKVGWVKLRLTRPLSGKVRNIRVTRSGGRWFGAVLCEWESTAAQPPATEVGIDRGVAQTLTLSTGHHYQAPSLDCLQAAHRRAQRVLARRKKGSGRYLMQRSRVAALAARATRIRTDWCHRTSTAIARSYGLVAIEALNIKGMTASAAGTIEEPGAGVAQKRGLNRSILEQCWGRFAEQLEYKLAERGGVLISVPAHFTSQTCASCGVVDARSRESQAVFRCVACGHVDNADTNAAKEILRRSTSGLDVEARVAGPLKRQPEENIYV